ncbi:Carbamoyl-phosphate synthase large chain [subsurface metagenome]
MTFSSVAIFLVYSQMVSICFLGMLTGGITQAESPEWMPASSICSITAGTKATEGTHRYLADKGIKTEHILKMHEGRPNIVDAIKNAEIQLIINTPAGKLSKYDDSYIRKAAIKYKVPYVTTTAAAAAAVKGIAARQQKPSSVKSLQSYHAAIK